MIIELDSRIAPCLTDTATPCALPSAVHCVGPRWNNNDGYVAGQRRRRGVGGRGSGRDARDSEPVVHTLLTGAAKFGAAPQ